LPKVLTAPNAAKRRKQLFVGPPTDRTGGYFVGQRVPVQSRKDAPEQSRLAPSQSWPWVVAAVLLLLGLGLVALYRVSLLAGNGVIARQLCSRVREGRRTMKTVPTRDQSFCRLPAGDIAKIQFRTGPRAPFSRTAAGSTPAA